jgi:hypothetical protein
LDAEVTYAIPESPDLLHHRSDCCVLHIDVLCRAIKYLSSEHHFAIAKLPRGDIKIQPATERDFGCHARTLTSDACGESDGGFDSSCFMAGLPVNFPGGDTFLTAGGRSG